MPQLKATFLGYLAVLILVFAVVPTVAQDCRDCRKDKSYKSKDSKKGSKSSDNKSKSSYNRYKYSFKTIGSGLGDQEKAIRVHKNVVMSFCVIGAKIRVNGWKRAEIRTFVRRGQPFDFKIRGVDDSSDKPTWVEMNSSKSRLGDCLRGRTIEIDAPIGATLKVSGRSGNTSIKVDSVASVNIALSTGDIALSNINRSIYAKTNLGAISVRNSKGDIDLNTTNGNIIAYDTMPGKIGDPFRARSVSGMVTLRAVSQKDVFASSISGTLFYRGKLYKYGKYQFRTTSGLISLTLPETSSCRLRANYGGAFVSHFELNNLQKRSSQSAVSLTANMGKGSDCSVSTLSYSGSITITKSNQKKKGQVLIP